MLLDWELGSGMSGFEVLKHIHGEKTCAATVEPASFAPPSLTCAALVQLSPAARVIMLSGNDPSEDDRNLFLQAGAAAFWVKPVTAHQIQSLALAKSK